MPHRFIEELSQKLADGIPESLKQTQKEVESHFNLIIESTLDKFNLVSREEFEIQQKVLLKTRKKLEKLEEKVANLEKTMTIDTKLSN